MEEMITLKQLSNIQNWLAKGVRIAFCLDEDVFVTNKIDMVNFKQIKEQIANPEKFKVFRIDSSNDLTFFSKKSPASIGGGMNCSLYFL